MPARKHLIGYYPDRPHVDSLTIPLTRSLLWRHEENRASYLVNFILALEYVGVDLGSETEVGNLGRDLIVFSEVQKDIFRFQIAVNIVHFVDLSEPQADVLGYLSCLFFFNHQQPSEFWRNTL